MSRARDLDRARARRGHVARLAVLPLALGTLVVATPSTSADPLVPGLPVTPGPGDFAPRLAFADDGVAVEEALVAVWDSDDGVYPDRLDWRYRAEERSTYLAADRVVAQPAIVSTGESQVPVAFVSDADLTGRPVYPGGDVYIEWWDWSVEDYVVARITCDPARESHPNVDGSHEYIAFATDADDGGDPGSDLDIRIAVLPYDGQDACAGEVEVAPVATGPGDQAWPTWAPLNGALVYSESAASDEPADLVLVPDPLAVDPDDPDADPLALRLTDTPYDETQPAAYRVWNLEEGDTTIVAFRTDQFRPDGSIGLVMCLPEECGQEPFTTALDPYQDRPEASVQGSQPSWLAASWPNISSWLQDLDLAFTSTAGDASGDVWAARLGGGEQVPLLTDQGRAVADPLRSESHASTWPFDWPSEGDGDTGTLLLASDAGTSNIDDVLATDGSDRRTIVAGTQVLDGPVETAEDGPAFSPDGRTLAYSVERVDILDGVSYDGRAIALTDSGGVAPGELDYERAPGDIDVDPVWSPDGTRLAFTRYEYDSGQDASASASPYGYLLPRVMVLDLRSGGVEPLLAVDQRGEGIGQTDPAWSPDGTTIAIATLAEVGDRAPADLGVRLADVDTRTDYPLIATRTLWCDSPTCDDLSDYPLEVQGRHPAWSPDGSQLVLADVNLADPRDGSWALFGGGALSIVTLGAFDGESYSAPDIQLLTRPSSSAAEADTGAVDPTWRRLTAVAEPAWSPDGTTIAFTGTDRTGSRDVWTVAVDGSDLQQVTNDLSQQTDPVWQPAPDVAITLTPTDRAPGLGARTTLTVTVTSQDAPAPSSILTVTLPDGLVFLSASCPTAAAALSCEVPPLVLGGSFEATFEVGAMAAGEHVVTAVVATPMPDADPGNDIARTAVTVAGEPPSEPTDGERPRLAFTDDGTEVVEATVLDVTPTSDPSETPIPEPGPGEWDEDITQIEWWWSTSLASGRTTDQASIRGYRNSEGSYDIAFVSSGRLFTTEQTPGPLQPRGDVYVLSDDDLAVRVTCDASVKVHPVVDPEGGWVYWATDAGGDLDIVGVPLGELPDACAEPIEPTLVAGGPGDQTWPSVVGNGILVYSSSVEPGAPSDLWAVFGYGEEFGEPRQVTDTPFDETQPAVARVTNADLYWQTDLVIAYRTDAYRPDGSIGLLVCDYYLSFDGDGCAAAIDPYAATPLARVQASEPRWTESYRWWDGEMDLAVASTADSSAGGIWRSTWSILTREDLATSTVRLRGQDRVGDDPLVSRTFPEWIEDWTWWSGDYPSAVLSATEQLGNGNVDDVRATDYAQRRTVVDERVSLGEFELELDERQPAYGVDGNLVAYSVVDELSEWSGRRLAVTDWNGVPELRPLDYQRDDGDIDVDPVWAPDGTRLAFVRYSLLPDDQTRTQTSTAPAGYAPGHVMVVTLATGEVEPLLPADAETDARIGQIDPAWSPDGRTIALSRLDGTPVGEPVDLGVHLVDVETRTLRPLLAGGACATGCLAQLPVHGRHPAWSPDSTRLVVADLSVPAPSGSGLVLDGRGTLSIIQLTGPDAVGTVEAAESITRLGVSDDGTPRPQWRTLTNPAQPAWSPDGQRIAFSAQHAGRDATPDIATVAVDGSGLQWATDDVTRQTDPAWQPTFDVALVLATSTPSVAIGEETTVIAMVTADPEGPSAPGLLEIDLPDGLELVEAAACAPTAAGLGCAVPSLGPSETFTVELRLAGLSAGTATIAGRVTTSPPDNDPENDVDAISIAVTGTTLGPPDLAVTIGVTAPVAVTDSVLPALWQGGAPGEATVTIRNTGQAAAPAVLLDLVWPEGLVPTGVAPDGTSDCLVGSGRCTLGALAAGAEVVLTAAVSATGPETPEAPIERSLPVPGIGPVEPPVTVVVTAAVSLPEGAVDPALPVDPSDETASAQVEVRLAQLRLAVQVARTGTPVTAVGYWFPPGQAVTLTWTRGITSSPGAITVAADGTFATTVLILSDGLLDDRDLQALTDPAAGTPAFGDARSRLLVVAHSVVAPNFLYRN